MYINMNIQGKLWELLTTASTIDIFTPLYLYL